MILVFFYFHEKLLFKWWSCFSFSHCVANVCSDTSEKCTASIFRVNESAWGEYWSKWDERMCPLYKQVWVNFGQSHLQKLEERMACIKQIGVECSKVGPFYGQQCNMCRWTDVNNKLYWYGHLVLKWSSPPETALPYNNTNPHMNQVCHLHPPTCRSSDVCPEFLQLSNSQWLSTSSTPLAPSTWLQNIHSNVPTELSTFIPTTYFSIHFITDSVILKMMAVCSSKSQNKPFLHATKPQKWLPPPPPPPPPSSSSSSQSLSLSKGQNYEILKWWLYLWCWTDLYL